MILAALAVLTAAFVGLEALLPRGHHPVGWHALVGLVSCLAGVLASKALGRAFLQRPERADDD